MSGRWYYRQDGAEFGPVALPQLKQMASTGKIHLTDCWVREGETSPWCPVTQSAVMTPAGPAKAAAPPPSRRPAPLAPPPPKPLPRAAAAVPPPAPALAPKPLPPRAAAPMPLARSAAPAAEEHHSSILEERRHRGSSAGTIIALVLGGFGAVIALVAVIMLSAFSSHSSAAKPGDDAANEITIVKASKPSEPTPAQLAKIQANQTKAIRTWRKADTKGGLKGLIGFEVKNVTWANASQGVLRVELAITNSGNQPVTFASWNSRGKTGAWLVDDKLQPIAAVTGSTHTAFIAPQQSIVETLEFTTGSTAHNELRLVLPYAAVERTGQWGYILDGATLRGEKEAQPPVQVAKTPAPVKPETEATAEPTEQAAEPMPLVIPAEEEPAVTIIASDAPAVDDGEPKEDIRDLIKKSAETK